MHVCSDQTHSYKKWGILLVSDCFHIFFFLQIMELIQVPIVLYKLT